MKKTVLFILFLGVLLTLPSQASALLSKTNFCYGTLGSTVATAAGVGSTFTFTPGPNAGACPTAAFKIDVFSAACSDVSSCATREIMTVTRSGTTFTIVTRPDEGTSKPALWAIWDKVSHDATAYTFDESYNANAVIGPGASTDNYIPQYNGTGGVLLRTGLMLDTDVNLTAASNMRLVPQGTLKNYIDQRIIAFNYGLTTGIVYGTFPHASDPNILYGISPLASLTSGYWNNAFGNYAGRYVTSGYSNNFFGNYSGQGATTGHENTCMGESTCSSVAATNFNTMVGSYAGTSAYSSNNSLFGASAGRAITSGASNAYFGMLAGRYNAAGALNTYLGAAAGGYGTTGSSNVYVGAYSGYYETGSNKLFIDNALRASESDGRIKALIYGIFDAAVANQRLTVNGQFTTQGHIQVTGTAPTVAVGSCGTVIGSITGTNNTDSDFTVTFGTGTPVLCGIAFAITWTATPRCTCTNISDSPVLCGISSSVPVTTAQVTLSTAAAAAGKIFNVHCE